MLDALVRCFNFLEKCALIHEGILHFLGRRRHADVHDLSILSVGTRVVRSRNRSAIDAEPQSALHIFVSEANPFGSIAVRRGVVHWIR